MFRIQLPFFFGPLDLLLYLVRKNELDIREIPIASVLDQYLDFVALIQKIDVNAAGDFLSLASMLIEIKALEMLPHEENGEEVIDDPRQDFVTQLLEYKKFCDAAQRLQHRSEKWQLQFPRLSHDLPPRRRNMACEPIQEVELWDLVSAFGRLTRENEPKIKYNVVYDDTPITTHMRRIHLRLQSEERIAFRRLFRAGDHKTKLIGLLMASLELVRHEFANITQEMLFGEIELSHRRSSKPPDFASLEPQVKWNETCG